MVAIAALALSALMLVPIHYARFSQSLAVQIPLGILVALSALVPPLRVAVLAVVLLYVLGGPWFDFWGILESAPLKRKSYGR